VPRATNGRATGSPARAQSGSSRNRRAR
jgi:hypothetical protein